MIPMAINVKINTKIEKYPIALSRLSNKIGSNTAKIPNEYSIE